MGLVLHPCVVREHVETADLGLDSVGRTGAREATLNLETDALVRARDQRNALIGPRREGQLNDWPQPQVRWAFGLSMAKPASLRPSL